MIAPPRWMVAPVSGSPEGAAAHGPDVRAPQPVRGARAPRRAGPVLGWLSADFESPRLDVPSGMSEIRGLLRR